MQITVVRGSRDNLDQMHKQTFNLPELEGLSVSNVLQYINRHLDGGLAYYLSCRRGLCACCVVKIDGKIKKGCVVPAKDNMVIEPIRRDILIKDTVVHLGMPSRASFEVGETQWMIPEMGLALNKGDPSGESRCD